jgi:hypothetical protein
MIALLLLRRQRFEFGGECAKLGGGLRKASQRFCFAGGMERAIFIVVADRGFCALKCGAGARLDIGRFAGDAGLVVRFDHAAGFRDDGPGCALALGEGSAWQRSSGERECRQHGG